MDMKAWHFSVVGASLQEGLVLRYILLCKSVLNLQLDRRHGDLQVLHCSKNLRLWSAMQESSASYGDLISEDANAKQVLGSTKHSIFQCVRNKSL